MAIVTTSQSSERMCYNIHFHHLNIDFPPDIKQKHFNYATRASVRHCYQLDHPTSAVNSHKFSFYIRSIPVWYSLPPSIFDNTLSVTQFRAALLSEP